MPQIAVILSGLTPSFGTTFGLAVLITLWLANGFAAATFSEMKFRSRFIHFIGGLLLPVVYPAFVFFVLPKLPEPVDELEQYFDLEGKQILTEGQKMTQRLMEKTGAEYVPKVPERKADKEVKTAEAQSQAEQENGELVIDHKYISSLALDADGNPLGPYIIELTDGRFIEAVRILDAYPEVFELEISGPDEKLKKIRLPYNKITSCVLKSEWMGSENAG